MREFEASSRAQIFFFNDIQCEAHFSENFHDSETVSDLGQKYTKTAVTEFVENIRLKIFLINL